MVRVGEIASDQPLTQKDLAFVELIKANNKTHVVDSTELAALIADAKKIYTAHFGGDVWFERSVFTNWTCGIADCKYCFLSTKPKLDMTALRSVASILAECFVMKQMGWTVGYITGGLRVESTEDMIILLDYLHIVLDEKPMMNFGPYTQKEVAQFAPHVRGMGSAVESFDEELHKFICPSKPLPALMKFLGYLKEYKLQKLITIILGIGEKMSDVDEVIKYVHEYEITTVQLCFLKPQQRTVFSHTPSPDPQYMAWWAAKLRIGCPTLKIKVALVKDRIVDFSLMLDAGVNCFSRYMVFSDFASDFATELELECEKSGRKLIGEFKHVPHIDIDGELQKLDLPLAVKEDMRPKIMSYIRRLKKLEENAKNGVKSDVQDPDCC
jgi:biotin synthase-like enzyme